MNKKYPYNGILIKKWDIGKRIVDSTVVEIGNEHVAILVSKYRDSDRFKNRFVKYAFKKLKESFEINMDDAFNSLQEFNYYDKNAGKLRVLGEKKGIPTQTATDIDYGVSILLRDSRDLENKNVVEIVPDNINIKGVNKNSCIGVHTYAQSRQYEIVDMRYLKFYPGKVYKGYIGNICKYLSI